MQKTPAKLCSLRAFPSVCAFVWLFRSQRPIRGHHFCLRTSKSPLSCNSKILQKFKNIHKYYIQLRLFPHVLHSFPLTRIVSQYKTPSCKPPSPCSINLKLILLTTAGKFQWVTLDEGWQSEISLQRKKHSQGKSPYSTVSHGWSGYIQLQQLVPLVKYAAHFTTALPQ